MSSVYGFNAHNHSPVPAGSWGHALGDRSGRQRQRERGAPADGECLSPVSEKDTGLPGA